MVAPSLNVTSPVGLGVPAVGVTVAVKVTLVPAVAEADDEVNIVVVAVAGTPRPVPVKLTVSGLSEALSAKVRVAVSLLAVLGSNWTLTVHVFPAATVALEQVSVPMTKSDMLAPPGVTVVMVRLALPVLVIVSVLALLVVPSVWFAKASGLGDAENAGAVGGGTPLIT